MLWYSSTHFNAAYGKRTVETLASPICIGYFRTKKTKDVFMNFANACFVKCENEKRNTEIVLRVPKRLILNAHGVPLVSPIQIIMSYIFTTCT